MARMNYYSNNNVANNSNNVNPSATNLNVNQNKMLELEKRRVHTVFNVLIPTIAAVLLNFL